MIYSFLWKHVKKYEIDFVGGGWRNGKQKRLGFIFGYISITTALITKMLTATERGKDAKLFFRNRC